MSILPVYLIAGLFTYHLSVFSNVPREEWVHHILFGGGIGGVGLVNPASPIGNALAFFICGLPGAVDYINLVLLSHGLISKRTKKRASAWLSLCLRAPGLIVEGFCMYQAKLYGETQRSWACVWLVVGFSVFNAVYFMQQCVGSYYIFMAQEKERTAAAGKAAEAAIPEERPVAAKRDAPYPVNA